MSVMTMVQAINNALDIKLAEDNGVVVYGEDVGVVGGVFRVTEGLQKKYGVERVFDSPLAESAIVGTGVGMALSGLRPVVEMQFEGFSYPAFNQIISNVSRMHNRSRGRFRIPMVIRFPYGGGINAIEHHSESPEALYSHIPGLKVVVPSTPHDAKGLLISAIESDDPVIFMEPKRIYRAIKQEVVTGKFTIPIGKASVLTEGTDVTVVAFGAMIRECQRAMVMAKEAGISVELIDLRTIYPIDKETIRNSLQKTGRLVVVAEAQRSFSVGSELIAIANEEAFLYLEAPPKRVMGFDTIIPLAQGEKYFMITPERIFYEIEKTVKF
ncbi:MAG TPA: alpha-ketoacid dehydrogenase subunit beta [Porphyromonadaceae bacterium]|jgi:pyruvate dehydrogenase E1 component beta subunit|uniref:alpha-ketoacid dehydrogenase subunit beta n=1 Tax=Petrimonas TaxID=307628 RepID=UPI000E9EE7BA|nr:alpha-ketoacid dehydrogenase subunit beta [Petrimonas sp.]BBD45793.1 transketolase [Petrimonas sp. IBARAKI]HAC72162.1 alpha-ketoacid dehydrogenase subunit beta [Porphyromonadaceae bacterium]MDD4846744.1 alpha-ketoacid dehydrogenase subunit beta [Petrimonas sp.]MDX9775071.1 alpha-ketoacid dehydrogenase subunit beta [Petrimonas sp.]